jgi:glucose-6-phosphate 1-dehydrogenase
MPQACSVMIFGATGDLTMRKLIPALYNIAAIGELPPARTLHREQHWGTPHLECL